MRKFLSLLLATAMFIIPTSAFANDEYDVDTFAVVTNSVFDADFSTFATDGIISDKIIPKYDVVVNGLEKTDGYTEEIGDNKINYIHFGGDKIAQRSKFGNFKVNSSSLSNLDNMTVEIWSKPDIWDADENEKVLFSLSKNTKKQSTFDASMNTENLTVRLNQTNTVSVNIEDYMNKWTHFVFIRSFDNENSSANIKVFINGVEKSNETFDTVTKQDESEKFFRVGTYGDNGLTQEVYTYKGEVSEVRVYDSVLETANINRNYLTQGAKYIAPVVEPDPEPDQPGTDIPEQPSTGEKELLFDMDIVGSTLSDIKDVSGNDIKITTSGSVSIDKFSGGEGDVNYVKIDNTSGTQCISFTDPSLLKNSETTIEFFMKKVSSSYPHPFIIGSNANSVSLGFEMCFGNPNNSSQWYNAFSFYTGNKGSSFGNTGGLSDAVSRNGGIINGGDWTHVVVTRTLDTATKTAIFNIYFNGALYCTGRKTDDTVLDKDDYSYNFGAIAGMTDSGNKYTGGYADIKVYRGIFSEEDVSNSFNANAPKYAPTVLTSDSAFDRNTSNLSLALNGVDLSNGYTFDFADANNADGGINGTATKTDDGFDISFNQYFKYGQQIKFTLSTKDSSGNVQKTFATKSVSKGDSDVEVAVIGKNGELEKPDGSDTYIVDVTVKNNGVSPIDYKYVFVAKDEKGASIACKSGSFTVANGSEHTEFEALENVKDAEEISVFVWEVKGGMFVPVYGLPIIIK